MAVGGTSPYAKMLSRPKEGDKGTGRARLEQVQVCAPNRFFRSEYDEQRRWVVAGRLQVNDARRVAGHSFPPTYKLRIVHAFPTLHTNLKLQEGHDPICHCS